MMNLREEIIKTLAFYKYSDTKLTTEEHTDNIIQLFCDYLYKRARKLNDEDSIEFQQEKIIFQIIKEIKPDYDLNLKNL